MSEGSEILNEGEELMPNSRGKTSGNQRSSEMMGPISHIPVIFPKRETSMVLILQPGCGSPCKPPKKPTSTDVGLTSLTRKLKEWLASPAVYDQAPSGNPSHMK